MKGPASARGPGSQSGLAVGVEPNPGQALYWRIDAESYDRLDVRAQTRTLLGSRLYKGAP